MHSLSSAHDPPLPKNPVNRRRPAVVDAAVVDAAVGAAVVPDVGAVVVPEAGAAVVPDVGAAVVPEAGAAVVEAAVVLLDAVSLRPPLFIVLFPSGGI